MRCLRLALDTAMLAWQRSHGPASILVAHVFSLWANHLQRLIS
jgi:hypothetical protein